MVSMHNMPRGVEVGGSVRAWNSSCPSGVAAVPTHTYTEITGSIFDPEPIDYDARDIITLELIGDNTTGLCQLCPPGSFANQTCLL